MSLSTVLVLSLLIGVVCGLRSMTAPAVVSWGAHLGWLDLVGSPLSFLHSVIAVVIFTVFAVGELIADKTAKIPARTTPGPLGARIVFGAACGAALGIAGHGSLVFSAICGAVGALIGAYGGYNVRHAAVGRLPDFPVALLEDIVAVAGGFFVVSRF